ncbi:hypothetical protein QFC20_001596 [Naganishia adeliensis]|uniref:Uncharacterized protein n=1 Tax=Naganishia adeliensis TaxID=92952 RepID=A0ACC2WVA0_9TREE|nr:hypothetical protein QFC20_001596 [Naganishia adeliensis]
MAQGNGKRKECLDNDDDEAQRVTVKRPALPLNTASIRTEVDGHGGSVSPAGSDNEDQEKNDSDHTPVQSVQPLVSSRYSNIQKTYTAKELGLLVNAQTYDHVKAKETAERALRQALDTIASMKLAEQNRILTQGREAIDRPILSKDDAAEFRLTSPRTLLGLDLEEDDKIHQPRDNRNKKQSISFTPRGMLKDQSWKLLLMFSREVVTHGMQYLEVSESPDWKPLHPEVKRSLVKEVSQPMEQDMVETLPDDGHMRCSLKARSKGDRWDPEPELQVWRHSWPLREMIKDTMDNIKDANRNHAKLERWCLGAMLKNPGPADLVIQEWPPAKASELLTAIQHRPVDSEEEWDE